RGELGAGPAAVGGRAEAKVDRDVPDPAAHAADQLRLGERRPLEVQAAQDAHRTGLGVVVLDEQVVDAERAQAGRIVGFGKPAALVCEALGLDQLQLSHVSPSPARIGAGARPWCSIHSAALALPAVTPAAPLSGVLRTASSSRSGPIFGSMNR